jgi:hypothetical protein
LLIEHYLASDIRRIQFLVTKSMQQNKLMI